MKQKKKYQKPSIEVYEMACNCKILAGSENPEFGYSPEINGYEEINHKA